MDPWEDKSVESKEGGNGSSGAFLEVKSSTRPQGVPPLSIKSKKGKTWGPKRKIKIPKELISMSPRSTSPYESYEDTVPQEAKAETQSSMPPIDRRYLSTDALEETISEKIMADRIGKRIPPYGIRAPQASGRKSLQRKLPTERIAQNYSPNVGNLSPRTMSIEDKLRRTSDSQMPQPPSSERPSSGGTPR